MFVRFGRTYYPQAPIDFGFDHENSLWRCPSVWLGWAGMEGPSGYEIIVARLSEDLSVATRAYSPTRNIFAAACDWPKTLVDFAVLDVRLAVTS